jgi:hypothetical protein
LIIQVFFLYDVELQIKQLEKEREKMKVRYAVLLAGAGQKDRAVDFSDLGVDALFVDESQEFKNLAYATSMSVSGLGNITGSAKALDLFIKCRYLQQKHEGRGVFFMTGTPISNSIAEVYTLQRYLQYDELKRKDTVYFDAWASTFGRITSGWELDATGVNYKLKSRFASFQNVPELLAMYRSVADVVTTKDLDEQARQAGLRPLSPPVEGGKPHNHVVERSESQAEYMESIIYRMEHLPANPRLDNPLSITNDARKAGLDYRIIEPGAPDSPGSKGNAAVERIFRIWEATAEDRGTQLVFCDLSTPGKGAFNTTAKAAESQYDFTVDEFRPGSAENAPDPEEDAAFDGYAAEIEDDSGEDTTVAADMDACLATGSRFSVYDDIKRKLMDKGVPVEEIAFIHDADTDVRKSKLFSDVQAGRVRILMGSTAKMGAGMNVQKRLVAAHHLDAPWRPSDLEQRNGRIVRQGNMFYERDPDNFSVAIHYYATKQTYDARMWQTIEYKAAAIEQFRKGDLLQRVIDDVRSEAANAAEMKAAASGNPLILLQVSLASDLRKLEALYTQHQRSQHRLKERLIWLNSAQERLDKAAAVYAENVMRRDEHTHTFLEEGKERIRFEFLSGGKVLREKEAPQIMEILNRCVTEATRNPLKKFNFGSYRGFGISVCSEARVSDSSSFWFFLTGPNGYEAQPTNLSYMFRDKFSLSGFFQRVDNFLDKGMLLNFERVKDCAAREFAELETVHAALGQEFAQKEELLMTRERHSAVIAELQRMQNEPGYAPDADMVQEGRGTANSKRQRAR